MIEGFVALQSVAPPNDPLGERVDEVTHEHVAHLLRCQLQNGPVRGGFVLGANARTMSVKTFDVQQALAALARYARLHHGREEVASL